MRPTAAATLLVALAEAALAGAAAEERASTPLHQAARSGRAVEVRILLGQGADINARDKSGATPLIAALSPGGRGANYDQKDQIALLLIEKGYHLP